MKNKAAATAEVLESRTVSIFIGSHLYRLSGKFQWELQTEELFCSDVIFALGEDNNPLTSKCLIHPEDIHIVDKLIERANTGKAGDFNFRVITTYGEIAKVRALGIFECEEQEGFFDSLVQKPFREYSDERKFQLQCEQEQQQLRAYQFAERVSNSGIWYFNTVTHEIFYSDEIFRMHGLPPQSLNAHVHTFHSFIHPEDSEHVITYFDLAYKNNLPLHLEYRILLHHTEIRYISQTTRWSYNIKGEVILSGVMQDITERRLEETEHEAVKNEMRLKDDILTHTEGMVRMASWHINLLTRKIVYSDQIYRIYGLKQTDVPLTANMLMKNVHPDDQEMMLEVNRKILYEHAAPDVEYRIIRPDGKTRYLRQKGKVVIDTNEEMVMIGTIIDITDQEISDRKLAKTKEVLEVQQFSYMHVEEMAGIGNWVWDVNTGEIEWSAGFYEMLGLKKGVIQITQRVLLNFIHPEDKKIFTDGIAMILQGEMQTDFVFRLLRKNETRYLQAHFRLVKSEEKAVFIGTVRDKTEEMLLEQQLGEQIGMADILSDASMDRVFVTDINNYIVKWNRRCELDYGVKKEKAIGKNIFDLFPQLMTPEVIGNFQTVLRGETVSLRDQKALLTGGYQHLMMVPVKKENQQLIGVLVLIHDATQEFNLRQELTSRLHFIEKLLQASVDRIIVLDRNMNYLYWNKKAEMYYGIRKEEVIGRNILEMFPGFIDDPSYGEFRKALKGETVHIPASKNLEDKKGYFETYLIPIKNEKDEVSGVLWIVHDLVGEYHLAQQQRRAKYILESINEAYIEVDFNGQLRYINPKAENMWGIRKEEVLGQQINEIFSDAKDAEIIRALDLALENKTDVRGEFFEAGSDTWTYLSCTVTDAGVIMLFYDITEAKKAEEKSRVTISELELQNKIYAHAEGIAGMGTWTWKPDTNEAHYSDNMFQLFGMEPQELQPDFTNMPNYIHPEDRPNILSLAAKLKEDGAPVGAEYRVIRKDGAERIFSNQVKLIQDENGERIFIGTTTDITDRKKAEEEVRKNIAILQESEDLAQIGSWEYEIATEEFRWSEGMYKLFGLPQQAEVRPEIYLDFAIEEDRSIAKRIIANLRENHKAFEESLRIKKGEEVHLLKIKASPVTDDKGKLQKIVGVDLDISDIKQAEESLKESRRWLEQTSAASPDSITVYDLVNRRPIYLNNCLAHWTGISSTELMEMGIEGRIKLVHPDDRLELMRFNEKIATANDHEILMLEYRIMKKDGKTIWLQNRSKAFQRDDSGKVTHILSILQDVTEQVELRQQLQLRTQYAETIIDASIDRILVLDTEFRIIAWNKRSEEIMGMRKEQVIGKKISELFPKVWEDEVLRKAYEDSCAGIYVHLPAKKSTYLNIYYERFYIPLKDQNNVTYAVLHLMHDVSQMVYRSEELTQLNQTLAQKNKELEQKNEEITHFAFVASHDLKEPVRKIHTFTDWLLQNEEKLSRSGTNYLEKLKGSVDRIDALIEDILVLTKIQSDRRKDEEVRLNTILEKLLEEMAEEITQSKAVIEMDSLPSIKGNSNQVFHLFKNLISNAIKFQKQDNAPHIAITAEVKRTDASTFNSKQDYLCINVTDNGFGFDNRYVKKIFQLFQRLHAKHEFEGTGVGLAICKKIMENHDGFITAESEPGKGSVFSCYFPLS